MFIVVFVQFLLGSHVEALSGASDVLRRHNVTANLKKILIMCLCTGLVHVMQVAREPQGGKKRLLNSL